MTVILLRTLTGLIVDNQPLVISASADRPTRIMRHAIEGSGDCGNYTDYLKTVALAQPWHGWAALHPFLRGRS